MNTNYKLKITRKTLIAFAKLYNIHHEKALTNMKTRLTADPFRYSRGVADYPDFPYDGMHWTEINNVIFLYSINEKAKTVRIRMCFSALTGFALKIFYGEYDPMED